MTSYWQDSSVNLYFNSATDRSIDEKGAKLLNKKATAPENYVTELQTDLIATGYLTGKADGVFGAGTKRAVLRFQRRAKNSVYRVTVSGAAADVVGKTYTGSINGVCDAATAKELQLWIGQKIKAPLGRFPIIAITGGRLRQDAANIFTAAVQTIKALGGTIDSPYGDTTRPVSFRQSTGGNSLFSLHYTGRAVDLNQGLAGGKNQRYYVVKEMSGTDVFWRIYCKTEKQDGKQGTLIDKDTAIKYYVFGSNKEVKIPQGYYLDLTAALADIGFVRIKAHSNWKTNSKGLEWWHFHYNRDLQETFQDELELVGVNEATLKANGWNTNDKLDRAPG